MKAVLIISILLVPNLVSAQGPIPPYQITWQQSAMSVTYAQSYLYKMYIQEESGVKHTIQLLNTLCGSNMGVVECSTALPTTAYPAIISNNQSQMTATDPTSKLESILSAPYIGDQGCIFRNNLFPVGTNAQAETRKQDMQALLNEFGSAKFKHVETKQLAGNRFLVIEQCVGYIVY